MGNRLLKESICTSENIDALPPFAETFFYRLIVNCDDYGRMDARPDILASSLFPLRRTMPDRKIRDALQALIDADLIQMYTVNGKPYLQMKTWAVHQRIRNVHPKYPGPEEGILTTCSDSPQLAADCGLNPNRIQIESNKNSNSTRARKPQIAAAAQAPTREEVRAYCQSRNSTVDPDKFYDFFTADPERQWIDSRGNPVKSWKQKLLTWEKADQERNGQQRRTGGRNVPTSACLTEEDQYEKYGRPPSVENLQDLVDRI